MLDRSAALARTVCDVNKRYGAGTLFTFGESPLLNHSVIPTGIDSLDAALGVGGIPKGKIIEIYGPEAVGKTALALHIAQQASSALFIDADHGLSPEFLADAEGIHLLNVETLEDALGAVLLAAPAFEVIVIDTLAALPTQEDLAVGMGDSYRNNPPAKILAHALPRLLGPLAQSGCTLILVNQLREVPGVVYGNPEKTCGGRALRHYAAMRLDVRRIEGLKIKNRPIGHRLRVRVSKNKCGPPLGAAEIELIYGGGIVSTGSAAREDSSSWQKVRLMQRFCSSYFFPGPAVGG